MHVDGAAIGRLAAQLIVERCRGAAGGAARRRRGLSHRRAAIDRRRHRLRPAYRSAPASGSGRRVGGRAGSRADHALGLQRGDVARRRSPARAAARRVCSPSAGGGARSGRRWPSSVSGSSGVRVSIARPAPLASAGSVTGARPPVACRCGSSNRSCGRVIGAIGQAVAPRTRAPSSAALQRGEALAQQRHQPVARLHALVVARQARVGQQVGEAEGVAEQRPLRVADTTARKICSPSFTVNTS